VFARIAVWEPMPDDDRQWVIDAAKTVPGVLNAYPVVDEATGNGLSIAFFQDDVDVAQVKAAIDLGLPSRSAGTTCLDLLPHPTRSTGFSAAAEPPRQWQI
jgi:hypothetical protein